MLATMSFDEALLNPWRHFYAEFKEKATEEINDPALSQLIRLACDGIWFSEMFQLEPLNREENPFTSSDFTHFRGGMMMILGYLFGYRHFSEAIGAAMLKLSNGFTRFKPSAVVVAGYTLAFTCCH